MTESTALLAVVIPVGPGDTAYADLLARLSPARDDLEIVLSACEPLEPDVAARVVTGAPGRARQLNRGVAATRASCLWLLHADSRPGPEALAAAVAFARAAAEPPNADAIGWFDLAYSADGPAMTALNARGANLRSRLLGLPFGDQGWLLNRRLIEAMGGFDETFGRGEDLEFIVRARAAGIGLRRIGVALPTSARRYRRGWMRTTLAHAWLTLCLWARAWARTEKSGT